VPDGDLVFQERLGQLYRRRWQIELAFKRLKSLARLGHLPKHDSRSSCAWLYGKLFVTLLAQKTIRIGRDISPSGTTIPSCPIAQSLARIQLRASSDTGCH
jgi:IS4 transposase